MCGEARPGDIPKDCAGAGGSKTKTGDDMSKVTLQDHNTGNTYGFGDVGEAEKAYPGINARNQARGFTANFTVRDEDGNWLSRNGEHPAKEAAPKRTKKAA
jgi:hypothetical protein